MKKITNPLDSQLKVKFMGREEVLEPNGSREVSDELAHYWKRIHAFLGVANLEAPKKETDAVAVETIAAEATTVSDTDAANVEEPKPAKVAAKKPAAKKRVVSKK